MPGFPAVYSLVLGVCTLAWFFYVDLDSWVDCFFARFRGRGGGEGGRRRRIKKNRGKKKNRGEREGGKRIQSPLFYQKVPSIGELMFPSPLLTLRK